MLTRSSISLAAVALFVTATGPAQSPSQTKPQPPVLSAWTEYVGDKAPAPDPRPTGHIVLRVVTSANTCPAATADGQPLHLTVREAKSAAFPITTCQANTPPNARHIKVAGIVLNAKSTPLQRIIVIGDTGCRLKGPLVQDCNDTKRWPFPLVAAHAAARHPDLVIHVGDYYYRESPCPTTAPGCAGSPHGDAWPAWDADFFSPVQPLLNTAPWIFVRGNHEQCGRGADGWFRLLDAAPTPQRCEDSITAPAFTVRIDGLTMNVMDSADTDDVTAPADLVKIFTTQFQELGNSVDTGHGWILTHRPIWGLDPKLIARLKTAKPGKPVLAAPKGMNPPIPGFNAVDFPSNRTEQVATDGRKLAGTDMIVSGHVHLFTALSFGPTRPAQLIAGNGGDNPDVAVAGPGVRTEKIDNMPANVFQIQRYGYLMMDRTKDGWIGTAFSVNDEVMASCTFIGRSINCLVAPSLPSQLPATASGASTDE